MRARTPEIQWFGLSMAFFAVYLFATLVPRGDTWGLHAYAYFPLVYRVAALAACALLLWPPSRDRVLSTLEKITPPPIRIAEEQIGFRTLSCSELRS